MNKVELVKAVAEKMDKKKAEAEVIVNTVLDIIGETLGNGEDVVLTGYLSLKIKDVPAKSGVTKMLGEEKAWSKEATKKVVAKVGKVFDEVVK